MKKKIFWLASICLTSSFATYAMEERFQEQEEEGWYQKQEKEYVLFLADKAPPDRLEPNIESYVCGNNGKSKNDFGSHSEPEHSAAPSPNFFLCGYDCGQPWEAFKSSLPFMGHIYVNFAFGAVGAIYLPEYKKLLCLAPMGVSMILAGITYVEEKYPLSSEDSDTIEMLELGDSDKQS